MNLDTLNLNILGPAFLAGLLVLATHVPLGQQVLKRGIVFIDLAVAQIAALGVIAADAMGWEPQGIKVQIAAVCAALLGALLLTWTEVQEALIGVFFVLAASAGILLLANNPHGGEHLKDLLAGQILWVSMSQLLPVSLLTVLILAVWFGLKDKMGRAGFYGLFALAVTASVQMVGIYLVFSSLIIPALAVRNWPESRKMLGAYSIGAVAYVLGLVVSAIFDLPSGAVIVWCLAVVGVLANMFTVKPRVRL